MEEEKKKEYLDLEGLILYDELLKEYIDKAFNVIHEILYGKTSS